MAVKGIQISEICSKEMCRVRWLQWEDQMWDIFFFVGMTIGTNGPHSARTILVDV